METMGYGAFQRGYRLYAVPSWLSGAARALDMGGTFDRYNFSRTGTEADRRAIASDWHRIGDDLRHVMMVAITEIDPSKAAEILERAKELSAEEGQQLRLMDA